MMVDEDTAATRNGLVQCLRMLTEEASILRLDRTFAALQDALATCRQEVLGMPSNAIPQGVALH